MKRNQKRERTHLVDQGLEEFMTYFRSTFGGFKELCQSVECPIELIIPIQFVFIIVRVI